MSELENREIIENLSNGVKKGVLTFEELMKEIALKVSTFTLGEVKDIGIKNNDTLHKAENKNNNRVKRIKQISQYYKLLNSFKDNNEVIVNSNGVNYINTGDEIFEITEQIGNSYITYNNLTQKYTIFSYDGKSLNSLLENIEEIEATDTNNWWKIIEENRLNIEKETLSGYCFIGDKGEIKYIEGGFSFGELEKYGNTVFFEANHNHIGDEHHIKLMNEKNGKEGNIPYGLRKKITLSNAKNLLIIGHNYNHYNETQSLYDLDEMKLLIEKVLSIRINQEKNTVKYFVKEKRKKKIMRKIFGDKEVTKEIDLN